MGRKEMDFVVFGIEDVGWFDDIVGDGSLGRFVRNLPTFPYQG